jgi:hypothetical protein
MFFVVGVVVPPGSQGFRKERWWGKRERTKGGEERRALVLPNARSNLAL